MDVAIETIEKAEGITLKIYYDFDLQNPRTDFEPFGTMVCWHSRSNLGDTQISLDMARSYNDIEKLIAEVVDEPVAVWLPLYLYEHSGMTIRTYPFGDPWDSGQVGFIYVTKEKVKKEFGCKIISKKLKEKVTEYLINEVKEYDQYLTGDVYGYVIEDESGEHLDSCWGFYGFEHVIEESNRIADWYIDEERKAQYANI